MEYTSRLELKKPQRGANADPLDINDLNDNFDKIDGAIGISDVKPREEFPEASASQEGKNLADENGVTWYCVKVRTGSTTYGYETITYVSCLDAERTGEGYEYATDTDKFYNNGEEIEVDRTQTELPEASEETFGKYYLIGTDLSLGTKTVVEDLYAWICTQMHPEIRAEERPIGEMEEGVIYSLLEEA